jgi:hypothetical protein
MIIIITSGVVMSIALNLKHILTYLNFKVFIKTDMTDYDCDNDDFLYIIIYNHSGRNPKRYIHYQIEQTTSNWFTPHYMLTMKNSLDIWEFAMPNTKRYKDDIDISNVHWMPMPFYKYRTDISNFFEYDILFYGSMNTRRTNILNKLKEKYKIKVCVNVYGEDIYNMIKRSKIILNIHFYKDATLESARFNEVLQFNRCIVSEKSIKEDYKNMSLYKDIVVYFDIIKDDLSNMDQLCKVLDEWLTDNKYMTKIEENVPNLKVLQDKSIKYVKNYFEEAAGKHLF